MKTRAYPFLKWAGGKRSLLPQIAEVLPERINNYYEPFLGGGAVFFSLADKIQGHAILSDLNEGLIHSYRMVRDFPLQVIDELEMHKELHCKEHYYNTRVIMRESSCPTSIQEAARFIYLNKTCFNGLYRVNSSGQFNTPMGSYKSPNICDKVNLLKVSDALEGVNLQCQSYQALRPRRGDLIYCDPPYTGQFTQYTIDGYDVNTEFRLAGTCETWRERGARVIISSGDVEVSRSMWEKSYKITEVMAARSISCKGSGRKKVAELLVVGDPYN